MLDFEQGAVFSYHYDFGDGWRHTVVVEEFLTLASTPEHGSCIAGARARPPEDVGGISGYERFLEIIADREDPEYAETIRWCGGYFDPEWFDLSVVDKDLRNALRSTVKRRPYQPKRKPRRRSKGFAALFLCVALEFLSLRVRNASRCTAAFKRVSTLRRDNCRSLRRRARYRSGCGQEAEPPQQQRRLPSLVLRFLSHSSSRHRQAVRRARPR